MATQYINETAANAAYTVLQSLYTPGLADGEFDISGLSDQRTVRIVSISQFS